MMWIQEYSKGEPSQRVSREGMYMVDGD